MIRAKSIQDQLSKTYREGEEREAQRRAATAGLKYLDLVTVPTGTDALKLIPEEKARKMKVSPFGLTGKNLSLAVFDPENKETKKLVKELQAQQFVVNVYAVSESSLKHSWSYYQYVRVGEKDISGKVEIESAKLEKLSAELRDFASIEKSIQNFLKKPAALSELVEIVLAGAMALRASDVHLEPTEKNILMRLRVDGILHDVTHAITHEIYREMISRIKLLSNLKLNVRDEPQDGRFTISVGEVAIEIRVSILPSEYGETIVMRILDPRSIQVGLYQLGLRADDLAMVEDQLKEPNGMILNTGPTGSGKTTTLYAFLQTVKNPEIKVITIEDPIEYHLEGIQQTQVDPEAGYEFADGLRSIMRQDPDAILVGEIRDKETAGIAIQAALTGHLVFSTVHANSSVGAVPRLIDLGVRTASIGPALNLVIAQRLVRRLCLKCKQAAKIDSATESKIKKFLNSLPERVDRETYKQFKIYEAKGCKECGGLGYRGRLAIFELLLIGPEMEKILEEKVSESAIKGFALKGGLVLMQQDGILKVLGGETSFDEVLKTTGPLQF